MTDTTGSRLDPAFVAELKTELITEGRGLWRYALRRFAKPYVPLSLAGYAILAVIFDDLPADLNSPAEILRALVKVFLLAAVWTASDVAAVHRSATRPDATIAETIRELDRASPRRWLGEGLRNGAIMALAVGGIVGTLMAFTTVPEELPGQSRVLMVALMIGVTAAWALPVMLLTAWARNRILIRAREMFDRTGLRAS
jgi:hypothetical protein